MTPIITRIWYEARHSSTVRDAIANLDRMAGDDPAIPHELDEARAKAQVARLIHDARAQAGLTQNQLAGLTGTTRSVIARLEDTDHEWHPLSMLNRIAWAPERRVEVRFVPRRRLQPA